MLTVLTAYRYQVGFLVPLATLAIGVLGKKVARGRGWERTDFYLGTEMTLAGVSGALVNIFDLLKPEKLIGGFEKKLMGGNIAIALLGLVLFYVTLSFQQDFGSSSGTSTRKQLFFLFGISNLVGLCTMAAALMLTVP